ncbi:DUF2062 domain-containing protein [Sphingomonas sp. M1-B02]|uniref:DUF2062 domain-containing protein n=1 Tax=Sphingomonas sp. M1-B02 TaxID=3114300 RepID=UPI00223ED7A5|nr:DUF2062 domain-containing protein [Sphingomonas sp. S6-11]UZK66970.1 DUF2062 domain-containing protein [Sphingomonas sp. S6-11]
MTQPTRLRRWIDKATPSRESIEGNRWLKPFARRMMHSSLWRFTRRSVPRGVALGMVTGILVPMGQIPASAVLALPFRANIPAAAATTFFTNPITTPPLWIFAYWLGSQFVGEHGAGPQSATVRQGWGEWLLNDAAPTLVTGLVTVTIILALIGYFASALAWRLWIAHKWHKRSRDRAMRAAG